MGCNSTGQSSPDAIRAGWNRKGYVSQRLTHQTAVKSLISSWMVVAETGARFEGYGAIPSLAQWFPSWMKPHRLWVLDEMSSQSNCSRRTRTQANLSHSSFSFDSLEFAADGSVPGLLPSRCAGRQRLAVEGPGLGPERAQARCRSAGSSTISARPSMRSCTPASLSIAARATSEFLRISSALAELVLAVKEALPSSASKPRRMSLRARGALFASTVAR